MDADQEDTRLAELREALRHLPESQSATRGFEISASDDFNQLSLDLSNWPDQISALTSDQITTLDLSSLNLNASSSINMSSITPSWSYIDDTVQTHSSKISLQGDDADIEINGQSMMSVLEEIRDRLAILKVSEEMEREWDELRILREQYENKLAECREKSQAWSCLKKS